MRQSADPTRFRSCKWSSANELSQERNRVDQILGNGAQKETIPSPFLNEICSVSTALRALLEVSAPKLRHETVRDFGAHDVSGAQFFQAIVYVTATSRRMVNALFRSFVARDPAVNIRLYMNE